MTLFLQAHILKILVHVFLYVDPRPCTFVLCVYLRVLGDLKPRKGMAWDLKIGHTAPHRSSEDREGLYCGLKGSNRENGGEREKVGMNIGRI